MKYPCKFNFYSVSLSLLLALCDLTFHVRKHIKWTFNECLQTTATYMATVCVHMDRKCSHSMICENWSNLLMILFHLQCSSSTLKPQSIAVAWNIERYANTFDFILFCNLFLFFFLNLHLERWRRWLFINKTWYIQFIVTFCCHFFCAQYLEYTVHYTWYTPQVEKSQYMRWRQTHLNGKYRKLI